LIAEKKENQKAVDDQQTTKHEELIFE